MVTRKMAALDPPPTHVTLCYFLLSGLGHIYWGNPSFHFFCAVTLAHDSMLQPHALHNTKKFCLPIFLVNVSKSEITHGSVSFS